MIDFSLSFFKMDFEDTDSHSRYSESSRASNFLNSEEFAKNKHFFFNLLNGIEKKVEEIEERRSGKESNRRSYR